jgi:hypothetical protein
MPLPYPTKGNEPVTKLVDCPTAEPLRVTDEKVRNAHVNGNGLVAIDLGSLAMVGAMHEVGAALSGLDLHFVRRLR